MRRKGLWGEPDFLKLWGGQAVSHLGSTITDVGLPLTAIMILKASPFQMGLLSGVGAVVVLVFGLFAGAWADRLRRRPILISADLGRAAILGTVPLAAALGRLSIAQLYLVAASASLLTTLFEVSYQAYLPSLVERENLVECNSKLALAQSAGDVGGPGLTGLLVQWITAPMAILFDAVSFLVSALSIASIRKPEPPPGHSAHGNLGREIVEGMRASWHDPILRALVLRTATAAFSLGSFAALYMVFGIRELGLSAGLLGAIISVGGASSLAGAFVAPRLVSRFGLGRTMIGAAVVTGVTTLLPALSRGPVALAAAVLGTAQLFDLAWPIYHINEITLRQAVTPDHLLGRVNSAMHLLFRGLVPAGALVAGAIAEVIGIRYTLLSGALCYLLSTLWLIFSPIRHLQKIPEVRKT
ncbi:MAG TPA: MFS transporter [Bryobacteraceae bacterium]|nr:MFS transporter [Bryobacteraceae bacterium]